MEITSIITIIISALVSGVGVYFLLKKPKPEKIEGYPIPPEVIPGVEIGPDTTVELPETEKIEGYPIPPEVIPGVEIGPDTTVELPETEYNEDTVPSNLKSNTVTVNRKGDPSKVAILFGINNCNPMVYNGDRLTLRGCVNDTKSVFSFLTKNKFGKIWYNIEQDCTIANFLKVWKAATTDLKDGDTLLIQMSRHGMSLGSNEMDNDQEVSKKGYSGDQAAVMYDGVIVDDCFWRLFMDLPKVKVIFINDSCHSGSQYRVADIPLDGLKIGREHLYRKPRSISKDYLSKKNQALDLAQLESVFGKSTAKDQKFDLISISGCQDWEVSMDAYINGKYQGAMTCYLLSALNSYPRKTLREIETVLRESLVANGFQQNPKITIEGDKTLYDQPLFV